MTHFAHDSPVIGGETSLGDSAMAGRAGLVTRIHDLTGDDRVHRRGAVWTLITKGVGNEKGSRHHERSHDEREYRYEADSLLWHGTSLPLHHRPCRPGRA
jgi:hypothetical protein